MKPNSSLRWRVVTVVLGVVAFAQAVQARLAVAELRTEWLSNPLGLDVAQPHLSWRVESDTRGDRQTAYRILAASSEAELKRDRGDLWDSGKVASDETLQIPYAGKALPSGQRVFWQVKAWDAAGKESKWSAPAHWGMGLLSEADWKAQWISFRDTSPVHADRKTLQLPPARHYRTAFNAPRKIARATLHLTALGLIEFYVNGKRAGDGFFEPGWSDYRQRVYSRAHDVTDLMRQGENCLGAIVADGWYAGYVGYGLLVGYGPNKSGRNFYGKTPACRAQVNIVYTDGSTAVVGTSGEWEVSGDGPIREADLIMGEAFDARRDDPGWCRPGGATNWKWEKAIRAEENGSVKATYSDTLGTREVELGFQRPGRVQAYLAPPIRVTQELKAQRMSEPKPGVYIFDLGQNFAGTVRLQVKAPAGTKLQLRYGEMLHQDGRLMTENLRKARATDFYICRGDGKETWTPRFTYHGFQYVEVTGLPAKPGLDAITGLVLHNDTPLTGDFACSDPVMTRFWKNTQWTQRANFVEVPTDCPQRDERLGWMGDAQIYARTATFNADVAAFYNKWIDDVREAQRSFGAYPDYCPYPMAHGAPGQTHGSAWTDAGIIVPYTAWWVYGDTNVIGRHWASMVKFMQWRRMADMDLVGVKIGNTWGDWLNVGEETPIEFIDLCYHAQDAAMMTDMARALGRADEAAQFARQRADVLKSLRNRFLVQTNGAYVPRIATQTAHVLLLAMHLLPDAASERATAARLAEKIVSKGHRMTTGFLGTKPLLPALTANGQNDLAVRLFQSRDFPSWGYEVVNGANSVWERWDSFTREHGFNGASGNQNASMNSFSHYSFGAVMEWGYRDVAGIDAAVPSGKQWVIRPNPPKPGSNPKVPAIDWTKASYRSARGVVATEWKRTADSFTLAVMVPANTTAKVYVPARSAEAIRENGKPITHARGVRVVGADGDRQVLEIGSGTYRFETRP